MRIVVSQTFAPDVRDRIRQLVRFGAEWADHAGVEIHVKARRPEYAYTATYLDERTGQLVTTTGNRKKWVQRRLDSLGVEAEVKRYVRTDSYGVGGMAYHSIPDVARVAKTTRWLVTISVSVDRGLDGHPVGRYPKVHRYLKRSPELFFRSWQDDVVAVTAHELTHVMQFQRHRRKSEVEAERQAERILANWKERT